MDGPYWPGVDGPLLARCVAWFKMLLAWGVGWGHIYVYMYVNTIGNSIKKNQDFPDTPFTNISMFQKLFFKKANAILTGRFIGKTYTEYRRGVCGTFSIR